MCLGELLDILLFGQCRRLLLEPHFLDFGACRVEFLLDHESRLLASAQLGAHGFQAVARGRQRLLRGATHVKLRLQRLLDRRPVDLLAFRRRLCQQRVLLRDLRFDALAAAR